MAGRRSNRKPHPPSSEGGAVEPVEIPGPHEVTQAEWRIIVQAFHTVTVAANSRPGPAERFTLESVRIDWVDWNLERDAKL